MTTIPTITTPRVTLRPPALKDFEAYAAFLASPRAQFMDGPHGRETAWYWFSNDTAHWHLYGYGGLMIETESGDLAGQVAVTKGVAFPEPELGWFILDGFTGQGLVTTAAAALRAHVLSSHPGLSLVSYIHPDNAASIRVAEKLGATHDPQGKLPEGDMAHVYRHPGPEMTQ